MINCFAWNNVFENIKTTRIDHQMECEQTHGRKPNKIRVSDNQEASNT